MPETVTLKRFLVFLWGWDFTVHVHTDGSVQLGAEYEMQEDNLGRPRKVSVSGAEIRHCFKDGEWQTGWEVDAIDDGHAKTVFRKIMNINSINETAMSEKRKGKPIWKIEEIKGRKKPKARDAA